MGELAQLITAIAALVAAAGTIWNISRTNRVHDKVMTVDNRVAKVETDVGDVKLQTNGMMEHLEKSATAVGHAAGVKQEREDADDRAAKT